MDRIDLSSLPQWLTTTVLAAALATLGFMAKQVFEWATALATAHRKRQARLVALRSLLNATAAVYRVQATLRDRLYHDLLSRQPDLDSTGSAYETVFAGAFETLNAQEREVHALIRSYTIHGLRPLNEAMVKWLQDDTEFKRGRLFRARRQRLATQLAELEPHLLLWRAKYEAWIPNTPGHALVYLADEENHGVPFPDGIETTIAENLGVRRLGDAAGRA